MSDSGLISGVPVSAIRGMSEKTYDYSIVINKDNLLKAIERLLLLNTNKDGVGVFEIDNQKLTIYDFDRDNKEEVVFDNECPNLTKYSMYLILNHVKLMLDNCEEEYITMNFGDGRAVVIKKSNIADIIQEKKVKE